ncbi:MAG: PadR family transcriptional regulator [Solirubrobacteraceae bacterium]
MENLSGTARLILGMVGAGLRTGYEIRHRVERSTRFFWTASNGQLYPELRRLERAGLLGASDEPHGERSRVVYELTAEGESALRGWLTDHTALVHEVRDEGLLKFYLADRLTPAEALELVQAIRAKHERVLDGIRGAGPPDEPGQRFRYLTWRRGLELNEWLVAWWLERERELYAELERERALRAAAP